MSTTSTLATAIGYGAATLSVISFVPQAWRIISTRETEGLSRRMYALTASAFVMWVVYGILSAQWPIIIPNTLCLMLSLFILAMLLLPNSKRNKVADTPDPKSR